MSAMSMGGKIIQCNIRDVTERKRLEEKLKSMSLIDDLTDLYNRRGFFCARPAAGENNNDPDNPASLDELIRRADALIYEQKRTEQR